MVANLKLYLLLPGILFALYGVIIFTVPPDTILLILIIYWVIIGNFLKLSDRYFLLPALGFLVLTPLPLLLNNENLANRFAIWEFVFLIIAILKWLTSEMISYFNSENKRKIK